MSNWDEVPIIKTPLKQEVKTLSIPLLDPKSYSPCRNSYEIPVCYYEMQTLPYKNKGHKLSEILVKFVFDSCFTFIWNHKNM